MIRGRNARLYINNEYVGDVVVQRTESSWSHGRFYANGSFAKFAPLFGQWSLIMHADGAYERLSDAASTELRRMEYEIDRLTGKLHFEESDIWVLCSQLNIDDTLIEWKSV